MHQGGLLGRWNRYKQRRKEAEDAATVQRESAQSTTRADAKPAATAPPPGSGNGSPKPPKPSAEPRADLNTEAVKSRLQGIKPSKRAVITYLALTALAAIYIFQANTAGFGRRAFTPEAIMLGQLGGNIVAFAIGFGLALTPLLLVSGIRDIVLAVIAAIITALVLTPGIGAGMSMISGVFGLVLGITVLGLLTARGGKRRKPTTFGSAEWASLDDVKAAELTKGKGFFLGGFVETLNDTHELHYAGDRHLLTVAPTRAGKGVTAIIPNLLTYPGSALVIDPKGENALITAKQRHEMGQYVMLLDPWDLASSRMGRKPDRFNPLDWLNANDPDLAENAMLLADALVIPAKGDNRFWDEEAKALIFGFLLYLATDEREAETKNLGRMRDLLTLPPEPSEDTDFSMVELMARMSLSDHPLVRAAANRYIQKAEKERASVMSSAQAQTHFLDSPRIRESLSASDFGFDQLKTHPLTIYLILPADRLNAFGRWLRLLIQQAITVNARNIDQKPKHPVLFMLDEMPALGHLSMVEQAYGLMAGFGIQLWGIVQDLSQLKRIYGEGWETFIGNSGVLQYFGSRDQMTAEYFSKLCGVTTIMNLSESIANAVTSAAGGGSNSTTTSTSIAQAQRNLAYPDELMRLSDHRQLLLVQNHNPIAGIKVRWFEHPVLKTLGVDLETYSQQAAIEAAPNVSTPQSAVNQAPRAPAGQTIDDEFADYLKRQTFGDPSL